MMRDVWVRGSWVVVLAWGWAWLAASASAQTTAPAATSRPGEFKLSTAPAEEPEKTPAEKLEEWIQKSKNPVPWFKWGADFRIREEIVENGFALDQDLHTHENNWIRYRPRVWFTVTPMKDFELNVRAIWEPRTIFMNVPARNPGGQTEHGWDPDYAVFDLLNFKWSHVAGLPLTIIAGRQEIALGDRWLVFDGTPLDGSRSLYLDAIRMTYEFAPIKTKADLMYISQSAQVTDWFPKLSHTYKEATEQREQGAILYVSNNSLKKTQLDGYFIYKHDQHQEIYNVATNRRDRRTGDDADIYTFGVRQASTLTDHWSLRDELAGQFGDKNGQHVCALATLNRLTYFFNDKYSNELHMDYEFVSGDDPRTKGTNEAFDMLWGRWPRWSELYIYTYAMDGGVAANNNLHRIAWGWQMNPMRNMQISLDYHLLFADENTYGGVKPGFSKGGKFRGQLLTWWLRYKFSEHLSSHVMAEVFGPGDYYTPQKNSTAAWVRWELIFSY